MVSEQAPAGGKKLTRLGKMLRWKNVLKRYQSMKHCKAGQHGGGKVFD